MVKETPEITPPKGSILLKKKELISLMISTGAIGFFVNDMIGLGYHVLNFLDTIR